MDRPALEKVAEVFSAFSDATRLQIIMEVKEGALTVSGFVGKGDDNKNKKNKGQASS